MTSENTDIEAVDPDARRDLLSQQFDDAAAAAPDVPAPAGPVARSQDGKFSAQAAPSEPEEPLWKRAPASWKKDHHEAWNTVDPRLQEYVHQRENQMKEGYAPLASRAKFADEISAAVEPYTNTIRGLGMDVPTAVKSLMEADHLLRHSAPDQRRAYLMQLARNYGVDLGDGQTQQQQPHQGFDPNSVYNEVNRMRGEMEGWKREQEDSRNQSLLQEISTFAKDKEHFEAARPTMIQLLQSGVATTLEDAYAKATRLDENLFESMQQAQQAKSIGQKRTTANQAAKVARGAAVSVRSSTPGATAATKAQDRRAMLAEQFDSVTDRF